MKEWINMSNMWKMVIKYVCVDSNCEPDTRNWSGFEQQKRYNETMQNNSTRNCVERRKMGEMLCRSVKMQEITFYPNLWADIDSELGTRKWSGF